MLRVRSWIQGKEWKLNCCENVRLTLKSPFCIGDPCTITAINTIGHVEGIRWDGNLMAFYVIYWINGERNDKWLSENEIDDINKGK